MKLLFIMNDGNVFHLCSVLVPDFLIYYLTLSSEQLCEFGRAGITASIYSLGHQGSD